MARCDALGVAPYSDDPERLYRAYLTPAHRAAIDAVSGWMVEAGMAVRLDSAGNLVGHYAGAGADAPVVLIGSHIDSVRDAGRYDGPLGVMLGIECVAALHAAGRRLPFAIEVAAFGDEEGSRFPAAMLSSRAMAGTLDPVMLDVADPDGVSLAQAFDAFGLDIARIAEAQPAVPPIAYLEAHIEQGPALEAAGLAIGTVTGTMAQLRYEIMLTGRAGHAGTTAMTLRADALACAAECVLAAERIAGEGVDGVVATVGALTVSPGAANVVPGGVVFTLDVRAPTNEVRDTVAGAILDACREMAARRGIGLRSSVLQDLPASPSDPALMNLMDAAIAAQGVPVHRLASGAGHDAMILAAVCPTVMLFVRCAGGISHNPAESVDPADVELALRAMIAFLESFGDTLAR